jgi:hypothetical protein
MLDWAKYCDTPKGRAQVVTLLRKTAWPASAAIYRSEKLNVQEPDEWLGTE